MKNLFEYINESNTNLFFDSIDSKINYEMINESIKSSIVMGLLKQITKNRKEQSEKNNYGGRIYYSTPLFKDMFRWNYVAWDKISDSDFIISKYINENDETIDKKLIKEREKLIKKIRSDIKDNCKCIIFLLNHKTQEYKYFIDMWGDIFSCFDGRRIDGGGKKSLSLLGKMSYVKEYDIYYLSLDDSKINTIDKRNERSLSKQGMINMDKFSLEEIAKQNVKRYKEIIAKNKSLKIVENDTIGEEVQEMVNRVMDLTIKFNKDIVKYADLGYKMDTLMKLVYDKRVYLGSNSKGASYSGQNGILYYFAQYMDAKRSALKEKGASQYSHNEYYNKNLKQYKNAIEQLLEKIDGYIAEIEDLMNK